MRRKVFSIWSVLLVLVVSIAVLLPGCDSSDGEEEPPAVLDHFKCYWVNDESAPYIGKDVYLEDQFIETQGIDATVGLPIYFCNPVEKLHNDVLTPISNPDHHLTLYDISYQGGFRWWRVQVENQFGTYELTVRGPAALGVPTQKVEPGGHEPPLELDHYLFWEVWEGPYLGGIVVLNDQFTGEPYAVMYQVTGFANPVRKIYGREITEILNPEQHLMVCQLDIEDEPFRTQIQVNNQFGDQTLDLMDDPILLLVPSVKVFFEPAPPPD